MITLRAHGLDMDRQRISDIGLIKPLCEHIAIIFNSDEQKQKKIHKKKEYEKRNIVWVAFDGRT